MIFGAISEKFGKSPKLWIKKSNDKNLDSEIYTT